MASFLGRETLMPTSQKKAKKAKRRFLSSEEEGNGLKSEHSEVHDTADDEISSPSPKKKKKKRRIEELSSSNAESDSIFPGEGMESGMVEKSMSLFEQRPIKEEPTSEKKAKKTKRRLMTSEEDDNGKETKESELNDTAEDEFTPPSPKKKKKKKKTEEPVSLNAESDSGVLGGDEESSIIGEKDQKLVEETKPQGGVWSVDDMNELTNRVMSAIPTSDRLSYRKRLERLDFEAIKFGQHTAEDCKEQLMRMFKKVRLYKTMGELVQDVDSLLKSSPKSFNTIGKIIHADMPKRPVSPYFSFCFDKQAAYRQNHPELTPKELKKAMLEGFRQMSEKKKRKYAERYAKQLEEYRMAMNKFKMEHPEIVQPSFKPPKSALMIYINKHIDQHLEKDPELSRKDLFEYYRKKWAGMSAERREKYIKKAIDEKKRLAQDFTEYCKAHPEFNPPASLLAKYNFSRSEKDLIDKNSGRPVKPLMNAFSLFSSMVAHDYADMSVRDRMHAISTRWKTLTAVDKKKYTALWEEKQRQYALDMEEWKASLPEEKRQEVEAEEAAAKHSKMKRKKLPANQTTIMETLFEKPVTALSLYIEAKKEDFKDRHPDMSDSEVSKALTAKYEALRDEKKDKYKAMELEENLKLKKIKIKQENGIVSDTDQSPIPATPVKTKPSVKATPKSAKKKLFPGAPKKPPMNGWSLFSAEMLGKLRDVPSKERMAVVSGKWRDLSEEEKAKFNERKNELQKKYKKDVEKFKETLSPEELAAYEETLRPKQPKPSKKKAAPKKQQISEKPEESNDKTTGDYDLESGSSSGSGSDSESESSSSGSSSSSGDSSSSESDEESADETEEPSQSQSSQGHNSSIYQPLYYNPSQDHKKESSSSGSSSSSSCGSSSGSGSSSDEDSSSDSNEENTKPNAVAKTNAYTFSSSGSDSDSD